MSIGTIVMIVFFGVPALGFIGFAAWRHSKTKNAMAEALRDTCLLCNSYEVDVHNEMGDYTCRECEYDSVKGESEAGQLVQNYRDLGYALEEFKAAVEMMHRAQHAANMDAMGGGSGAKYEYLGKAGQHQMNGMQYLKDLTERHPELLDMAVAGANITASDAGWDQFGDDVISNMRVRGKVKESRERIEKYTYSVHELRNFLRGKILERVT